MHKKLCEQVVAIVRQAADKARSEFRKPELHIQRKVDGSYVTDVDHAIQDYLQHALGPLVPGAQFVAEESDAQSNGEALHTQYQWVIDPIDGTTNFVHGLDHWAISVALTHYNKPVLGVVAHPTTDTIYYAYLGGGAFCNDQPIQVARNKDGKQRKLLVEVPLNGEQFWPQIRTLHALTDPAVTMRHLACASLDQALVAAGSLDGIFFGQLGWWDIAAGMLLIQEAGGVAVGLDGQEVTPAYTGYVAGSHQWLDIWSKINA